GPRPHPPRHEIDAALQLVAPLPERPLRQVPGRLDELRVVERDQRLQRRVRPLAPHGTRLAVRGVQDVHRRGRRGPLPERVQAAAVQRVAAVAAGGARVGGDHRPPPPHPPRLVPPCAPPPPPAPPDPPCPPRRGPAPL